MQLFEGVHLNVIKEGIAMQSDNCSVLILSCDKNISLLKILFDFLNRNWEDCPFNIYVGLEKGDIKSDKVKTLLSASCGWGGRLLDYLDDIKTDFIMLILDDFLPEKTVETSKVIHYLEIMNQNKNIATISFADIFDGKNKYDESFGLCRRTANANYLLNLQVGIWNVDTLKCLLKSDESPWQTELFGSIRARKMKDKLFLCLRSDEESPYRYNRGWLMVRGIWNGNEIKRLGLEKYAKEIFDGKDIQYSGLMHIDFIPRVKRRLQIEYRKLISHFGIYI